jgi:hypothetical protein
MEKKCAKCGEVKPLDLFSNNKTKKDGKQSQCKKCSRELNRKWYLENAEKAKEAVRKWRLENREKERERARKWSLENPEKARERFRKWYLENAEKARERAREWNLENPDKVREHERKWRDSLSDGYVTKLIKRSALPPEIIEENPELIELKRLQIQLNRKINQKKKEL